MSAVREVLNARSGSVLSRGAAIKSDHFPGCQRLDLDGPKLPGAPNFRQVRPEPNSADDWGTSEDLVFGVAMCTLGGAVNVLRHLLMKKRVPRQGDETEEEGEQPGDAVVYWYNLREEPVVYINCAPYVLRDEKRIFRNLEFTGIDDARVESLEARFKHDIREEANKYDGRVVLANELPDGTLVNEWVRIEDAAVEAEAYFSAPDTNGNRGGRGSKRSLYPSTGDQDGGDDRIARHAQLTMEEETSVSGIWRTGDALKTAKEGIAEAAIAAKMGAFDLRYRRIPITDEKAPPAHVCAAIASSVAAAPPGACFLFHCQMGRGRTTTGMIIGLLTLLGTQRPGVFSDDESHSGGESATGSVDDDDDDDDDDDGTDDEISEVDRALQRGLYPVVLSLMRVLPNGVKAKQVLDDVIDRCGAMQNLRTAIGDCRKRIFAQEDERKRSAALMQGVDYLERYCVLLAFSSYVSTSSFAENHGSDFASWMEGRREIKSAIFHLIHRNPLSSLAPTAVSSGVPPPMSPTRRTTRVNSQDGSNEVGDGTTSSMYQFIAGRTGNVLSSHTILKLDRFPGHQSSSVPVVIEGAPNLRGPCCGLPVFGLGTPDSAAIHGVAAHVARSASPTLLAEGAVTAADARCRSILWLNMREEPYIYIDDVPYVLRIHERPFKNLQEYSGIDGERLEEMERLLHADVIAEIEDNGGKVLICVEDDEGFMEYRWKTVRSPGEQVHTPLSQMQRLGDNEADMGLYRVHYERVPITDGTGPKPEDFDRFCQLYTSSAADAIVFSDQTGKGRTTTGMVIGCALTLFHRSSVSLPAAIGMVRSWLSGGGTRGEDSSRFHADSDAVPCESIRIATRSLEHGDLLQQLLNGVIDACAAMVNIRLSIATNASSPPLSSGPDSYRRLRSSSGTDVAHVYGADDGRGRAIDAEEDVDGVTDEQRRTEALRRAGEYLERYLYLLFFMHWLYVSTAALPSPASAPSSRSTSPDRDRATDHSSFRSWVVSRKDIQSILGEIRTSPSTSLARLVPHIRSPGSALDANEGHRVVMRRSGSLLAPRTILKRYIIRRRPLCWRADVGEVYGAAALTMDEIREVCSAMGAGPDRPTSTAIAKDGDSDGSGMKGAAIAGEAITQSACHLRIIDVREEPIVYIDGCPYVLRDVDRPLIRFNHRNISSQTLTMMERKLREEINVEAMGYDNMILVHETEVDTHLSPDAERIRAQGSGFGRPRPHQAGKSRGHESVALSSRDGGQDQDKCELLHHPIEAFDKNPLQEGSDIRATWKPTRTGSAAGDDCSRPSSSAPGDTSTMKQMDLANVLTTREMFSQIRREGYKIEYYRTPFSRIRDVTPDDFDAIRTTLAPRGGRTPGGHQMTRILFMSHIGYGSVGYGMSIAASSPSPSTGAAQSPQTASREDTRAAFGTISVSASPLRQGPAAASRLASMMSPVVPLQGGAIPVPSPNGIGGVHVAHHPFHLNNASVSSFLRLLSFGLRAKEQADNVLHACRRNGCIIDDIRYCQRILDDDDARANGAMDSSTHDEAHGERAMMVQRARSFLKKYYQMYMMLIAYNAYLLQTRDEEPCSRTSKSDASADLNGGGDEGDDEGEIETFAVWFNSRPELRHFLERIEP